MQRRMERANWRWPTAVLAGAVLFLSGCDPTVRATVENGVIAGANSLLTAVLQALVQLGQQATSQPSGGTTQAIIDVAQRILA